MILGFNYNEAGLTVLYAGVGPALRHGIYY